MRRMKPGEPIPKTYRPLPTLPRVDVRVDERNRIRAAVVQEICYMIGQGYSEAEVDALRRALSLIEPKGDT